MVSLFRSDASTPGFEVNCQLLRSLRLAFRKVSCFCAVRIKVEQLPRSAFAWTHRLPLADANGMMLRKTPAKLVVPFALVALENR